MNYVLKHFEKRPIKLGINLGVFGAMLICLFICVHDSGFKPGLFFGALGLSIAAFLIKSTKVKFGKKASIVFFFASIVGTFYLMESYTHFAGAMSIKLQLLNLLLILVLFLFLAFAFGSASKGAGCGVIISMVFMIINYYVIQLRSTPLLPWDFMSADTAFTVTNNYKFEFAYRMILVTYAMICLFLMCFKMNLKMRIGIKRIVLIAVFFAALIGGGKAMSTDFVVDTFGLDHTLFTPLNIYKKNGFYVSFLYNLQFVNIKAPKGYSEDKVAELAEYYQGKADEYNEALGYSDTPNIIVVVDETFSDLSVLGPFETNVDYMPFMRGIAQNTIKGYAYTSVVGGNTPNSEFEFLTNNSMAFLPVGSIPFQQYFTGELPSYVSITEGQDYTTFGSHPYYASGWDRDEVYPWLGFDNIRFKNDFTGIKKIRDYISDETVFNTMLNDLYNKNPGEKLFDYVITMQNHGGFYKDFDNFEVDVEVKGSSRVSTRRYLSLIKITDESFENFLRSLRDFDEKTIVIIFGDHQPNADIVEPVLSANGLTSDNMTPKEQQNRYKVPFLIWANYDIDEANYESGLSLNYLNILLSETAGLKLSGYQMFLKELMEKIPVITANCFIDSYGNMYDNKEDTGFEEIIDDYAILQYNYLFGKDKRLNSFFTVSE